MPGYSDNPLTCASAFAKVPSINFLQSRGAYPAMNNCRWGQFQLKPLGLPAECWMKDADAAKVIEVLPNGGARCEGGGVLKMAAREGSMASVKVLVGWGEGCS